jgi:cob(I)alamin adenosyltransferase
MDLSSSPVRNPLLKTRELMSEVKVPHYTKERAGFLRDEGLGLVHVYYGQGVGKTTRTVGLTVRAAGAGLEVHFVQFMKSGTSGEVKIFQQIPRIHYWCAGEHPFIMSHGPDAVHYEHAAKGLACAQAAIQNKPDLIVCDEILDTLLFKTLREEQILELIHQCKGRIELVMTGRSAPEDVLALADYATEFVQVKHPYYAGARARKGIEY